MCFCFLVHLAAYVAISHLLIVDVRYEYRGRVWVLEQQSRRYKTVYVVQVLNSDRIGRFRR